MQLQRFEHLNLSCKDIDVSQKFYQTLFPDWRIRSRGVTPEGLRWRHFGNDRVYIALNDATNGDRQQYPYEGVGLNHVGLVIDDGEELKNILKRHGIEYYVLESPETRHRIYVSDPDGNEIEFVEYTSEYPLK